MPDKAVIYTAGLYYFEESAKDFGKDYAAVPIPAPVASACPPITAKST
jgi:hypothetical protein